MAIAAADAVVTVDVAVALAAADGIKPPLDDANINCDETSA